MGTCVSDRALGEAVGLMFQLGMFSSVSHPPESTGTSVSGNPRVIQHLWNGGGSPGNWHDVVGATVYEVLVHRGLEPCPGRPVYPDPGPEAASLTDGRALLF